jgi:hypothetical protein
MLHLTDEGLVAEFVVLLGPPDEGKIESRRARRDAYIRPSALEPYPVKLVRTGGLEVVFAFILREVIEEFADTAPECRSNAFRRSVFSFENITSS